ncbi:MAG TPA: MarR family transcriptional regulator [Aliidongia sp.]|uniref:MarR family winged helix-turn-helix transcriptional regulator n=1 Tax=Aliidongia sp. TaxID=1914230 RepID=UPI002DDCF902|nr:MarR family transcriptional regulator [Aliidongia sp.]HEV2677961.1 MarR family transcriptional regulator [Aliidongia sp.]
MIEDIEKRQHVVNEQSAARSPAGDAFAGLAILVLRLAGHLTLAGDALAKPVRQTSARWQVLAAAGHGTMSVAQIARVLGVTRQAVQRLADLIEADGLARYQDNPAHQRAKLLVLTDEGRQVLAAIKASQATWANALGAELGETDLRAAGLVLDRVLGALTRGAAGDE